MIFGKTGAERGWVFAFLRPGMVVQAHGSNRAELPFRAGRQRQTNSFRKTRRCRLEKRRTFHEKLTLRVHVPFGACPLSRLLLGLPTASRAAECRGTCFLFPACRFGAFAERRGNSDAPAKESGKMKAAARTAPAGSVRACGEQDKPETGRNGPAAAFAEFRQGKICRRKGKRMPGAGYGFPRRESERFGGKGASIRMKGGVRSACPDESGSRRCIPMPLNGHCRGRDSTGPDASSHHATKGP